MFERDDVSCSGERPVEFTYRGRRFRIHSVLTRWREAGGWWNRISNGELDDQSRAVWRVEAAPLGTLNTFELIYDEKSGQWLIKTA